MPSSGREGRTVTGFIKRGSRKFDEPAPPDTVVLIVNDWDDYGRKSTFIAQYWTNAGELVDLGKVKIIRMDWSDGAVPVDDAFPELDDEFASLGQSQRYYESIAALPLAKRRAILQGLKDVAADPARRERFSTELNYRQSLAREIDPHQIDRFAQVLRGAYEADSYQFAYTPAGSAAPLVDFRVDPDSLPASNLHVLIGRNGVGKTTLLANMAQAACTGDALFGHFSQGQEGDLEEAGPGNVISISFSAFDTFDVPRGDGTQELVRRYAYVGLRQFEEDRLLSQSEITDSFCASARACIFSARRESWRQAIAILQSDPELAARSITSLCDAPAVDTFDEKARAAFGDLSSGHKIVLLTISRLVELLEDRTIVFLDEPEGHLHPPLLASLVRSISTLLREKNAAAVVATHSPVVLQEISSNCAWLIDRPMDSLRARRPTIETFAENVGILTHEVFGLEVMQSGHFQVIKEALRDPALTSLDDVLRVFRKHLGGEGRAIALALLSNPR